MSVFTAQIKVIFDLKFSVYATHILRGTNPKPYSVPSRLPTQLEVLTQFASEVQVYSKSLHKGS